MNSNGIMVETPDEVTRAFVDYYVQLLGTPQPQKMHVSDRLVKRGMVLNESQKSMLCSPFNNSDIKAALWAIDGNKAPGYDGYSSRFFKDAWEVIVEDLCEAVQDFFCTGKLLQQVNTTVLTLIPKIDQPQTMMDFRPIACCSVIYKCVSKLICSRLKCVLGSIVNEAQSAFVEGRQIVHNVMLVQKLMNQYKRENISLGVF